MVRVADNQLSDAFDINQSEQWIIKLPKEYGDEQKEQLSRCFALSKKLIDNHPETALKFKTGLVIADILLQLKVDASTLACAIIYPFYHSKHIEYSALSSALNGEIANLCKGVAGMEAIHVMQSSVVHSDQQQMDNLRRMLLAMVDDVRLVLVKLAERLSVLRNAKALPEKEQVVIATQIQDVYAPLANRLGVGQIKWEMEDLSFRYLQSVEYMRIAKNLDERRLDREDYVNNVLSLISKELDSFSIKNAELMGRAKHIYSIWRKMCRKNVGFSEIYDVRAVRILVDQVPDCYATLGIVHGLWKHIPKEFDDYIATPKENGYQSLHTAVIGPNGKTLEIQIRTKEMHEESELGVAAHWMYKEGAQAQQSGYEAKITWLRQLLDWQEEVADANAFLDKFRSEVVEDRVYVFTPQGKVVDLPLGSTAVDFAYHVHTQVGHNCRGAKVSGRIVPLTYQLKTGEQIEILTTRNGHPSRDWLNPHNGYIRSSRARSKIHQWFRHQDKEKNAAAGRTILDKDFQRHGIRDIDLEDLAKRFNLVHADDLYAAIGAGDLGMTQVLNTVRSILGEPVKRSIPSTPQTKKSQRSGSSDIEIQGVGNLLTRIAGCCKPVPGDAIIGYITQGRGVVVHRNDCNYITKAQEDDSLRLIEVSWGSANSDVYSVDLKISAYDRQGLLRDITTVFANEKVSVESLNTSSNLKQQTSAAFVRLNVENTDKLSRVLGQLEQIPNVFEVKRQR